MSRAARPSTDSAPAGAKVFVLVSNSESSNNDIDGGGLPEFREPVDHGVVPWGASAWPVLALKLGM